MIDFTSKHLSLNFFCGKLLLESVSLVYVFLRICLLYWRYLICWHVFIVFTCNPSISVRLVVMSHFSLLIFIFQSFLSFFDLSEVSPVLLLFQITFGSVVFSIVLLSPNSLNFALIFIVSFLLWALGCSSFSTWDQFLILYFQLLIPSMQIYKFTLQIRNSLLTTSL